MLKRNKKSSSGASISSHTDIKVEAADRRSPWTQPGPSVRSFELQQDNEAKELRLASLIDNIITCLQIEIGVI